MRPRGVSNSVSILFDGLVCGGGKQKYIRMRRK